MFPNEGCRGVKAVSGWGDWSPAVGPLCGVGYQRVQAAEPCNSEEGLLAPGTAR